METPKARSTAVFFTAGSARDRAAFVRVNLYESATCAAAAKPFIQRQREPRRGRWKLIIPRDERGYVASAKGS